MSPATLPKYRPLTYVPRPAGRVHNPNPAKGTCQCGKRANATLEAAMAYCARMDKLNGKIDEKHFFYACQYGDWHWTRQMRWAA